MHTHYGLCSDREKNAQICITTPSLYTVKHVRFTTFIRWPPTDDGHISVELAKSYIVSIYDHVRNLSTFICWIPVYVSHAKWNRGTVYIYLYWPWQYFGPVKWSKSLCLVSLDRFFVFESYGRSPSSMYRVHCWKVLCILSCRRRKLTSQQNK
jgi:hypothetical protein